MQSRLSGNPMMMVPGALQAILALGEAVRSVDLPANARKMIHLRASQINGCSYCVDMHTRELRQQGESEERIATVAAWRDAPWFDDGERALLALTEAATRLADRSDPVPDAVWNEAARHFDETLLAAAVLEIGMINLWNRVNVVTRQVAGPQPH
ncbi:MAG TPA: carboxymuconolactone decarboxylase family protein [Longimicrobium sp.]|jgi:AhpD family alkylhydroperoxidase